MLEKIADYVVGDGVEVIYDGPRAYYDERLYPLFCRFELVLRRLLLAATRVNPSAKGASAFRDQLDRLTPGSVFTFLFSSQDFNK